MNINFKAALCAALILSVPMSAQASPEKASKDEKGFYATGRILVKAKPGLSEDRFLNILAKRAAAMDHKINGIGVAVVKVPPGLEKKVMEDLLTDPSVDFAELDRLLAPALVPNDPYFGASWHHTTLKTEQAWDVASAEGITIAILDTGTNPVADLAAVMVPGWNAVSQNTDTADINGHGTAVAGIAAAIVNNGLDIAGVARNAKVMPVRITNDPTSYAYYSDVANGLIWAADHGARVVNNSYQSYTSLSVLSAADYLKSKGGISIFSAGNDGAVCSVGVDSRVVVVSSTNSADGKSGFSTYGDCLDLAAPGEYIRATSSGGGVSSWTGTSMAAPLTAGLAALIYGVNPSLSGDDVEAIMKQTAYDPEGTDFSPNFGYGRIDAAAAVALAQTYTPTVKDTAAPSVAVAAPVAGATVNGLVNVGVNASDNVGVTRVDLNVNGAFYASDTTAPFSFSWDTTPLGNANVTLTAKAYDAAGNAATSSGVGVKVQNIVDTTPPVVAFNSPASGSTVSGTVNISVSATDNVQVASITLDIDGKRVTSTTAGTLSYSWSTRRVTSGTHTLKAIATDTSGNKAEMILQVKVGGTVRK